MRIDTATEPSMCQSMRFSLYKTLRNFILYGYFIGQSGNSPMGRPSLRWEGNIKADLHKMGCGGMDRIELAEDRKSWRALVNAAMKIRFP
jgi:hypothetical protein